MAAYRFGGCLLDLEARELRVDGDVVNLEPQVFDVLAYLVRHRTRMVSKTELLDAVWGSQFVSETALTSRIKSARAAIGDDGSAQRLIRTERGRGYRFIGDTAEVVDAPSWRGTRSLPSARVPLIGRTADVDALGRLLRERRIVTISGPGGAGKSTLALEVARRHRGERGLDVSFAELAPVQEDADVVRAVAEVTGVEGAGASDVAALAATLGPREALLVLDNCEHLLDASAALVHAVLDAAPGMRVLATTREPLGVDGEAVYVLGSLGADAATMFVERAVAATGRVTVVADDPRVVELCDHLDGLPLAIELAAAQTRHLTLDDLASRLDHSLGILVAGRPRAGHRHATLAATIDWSHRLLSDASRDVFDRLGVFPAGFDLDAVRAVCPELDPVAATNTVGDLVAKNLLVHDHDTGRYRLLETIRLFAADRLDASGQRSATVERLRRHVAERMASQTRHGVWLSGALAARNRDDIENVRAAFDASVAGGRHGDAVDIMLGLSSLWRNAVWYAEGLRWVARARPLDLAPRDRLWLHIVEADLGLGSGDPRLMNDASAAAAGLVDDVDDAGAAIIVAIYRALAVVSRPEEAIAGLEAARDHALAAGEPELHRLARGFRAAVLVAAARDAEAQSEIRDLTARMGYGYDRYIWIWAGWLGALVDRDGRAARQWMARQGEAVRATGLRENWLVVFSDTMSLIAAGADYRPYLVRARHWAQAEGRPGDVDCVLALAYAAACDDDPVRAAELLGAIGGSVFRDTASFVHHMIIRDRVVRPRLEPDVFDAALARGDERPIAMILAEHGL
jgi:predicted ATPase/DNA-binding winged helix-turn-helix (wHTH) protein